MAREFTKEQLDRLNAAVHVKIMDRRFTKTASGRLVDTMTGEELRYTEDIAQAWPIIDKLRERLGLDIRLENYIDGDWDAQLTDDGGELDVSTPYLASGPLCIVYGSIYAVAELDGFPFDIDSPQPEGGL